MKKNLSLAECKEAVASLYGKTYAKILKDFEYGVYKSHSQDYRL